MTTMNDYIESGKKYVKDHAAPVITAAAAVVTALTVIGLRHDLNKVVRQDRSDRKADARVVSQCIAESREFDYLPGLGVHVHEAKDNLITEKN